MHRALAAVLVVAALPLSAAHAQQPTLPRVMRAALGSLPRARLAMPPRWPRAPLGGPVAVLADDVAARLLRLPALAMDAGLGATVCVIDTGADLAHAALRTSDGRTRVRALLDLDSVPRGSAIAEVAALEDEFAAAVWDSAAIDAALALDDGASLPRDTYGHGTAVAALAVGGGIGVAQGAELVVVRALRTGVPGFRDEDLALGAQFCARASRDPRRTVVVLALGGHDGAHDGGEPVERSLAAFPGLVVAAAGNDGGGSVHASALLRGEETRIVVRVPSPGNAVDGEQYLALAITLTPAVAAPRSLEVALEAPDGTTTAWAAPDTEVVADARGARLALQGHGVTRSDGTYTLHALIAGGGELPMPLEGGVYVLRVRGHGRVDAWLAGAALDGAFFPPRFDGIHADHVGTITIPGTAPELVTVGAIASRVLLGALAREDDTVGLPASFTSVGPTRSGAPKPDVAAPGTLVVTALSRDVRAGERNLLGGSAAALASRLVAEDRVALDGSSYSAALVAGALALALAEAPARGDADRALLATTASRMSAQAWDAGAGMGAVDVTRFLAARRARLTVGTMATLVDASESRASFTRSIATAGAANVFVVARIVDLRGAPLSYGSVVLGRDGHDALTLPVIDGLARGALPGPALVRGTLRFSVHTDDGSVLGDGVLRVEADPAEARMGAARGGACAAAPGGTPPVFEWVFAVAALLCVRAGRRRGASLV